MKELTTIQNKIYEIRGQQVMLDFDLAALYQVETKRLKEAVRRNIERFEGDEFMFELTEKEYADLRSQIATSSWGGIRYQPFAFTELLQTIFLKHPDGTIRKIKHITVFAQSAKTFRFRFPTHCFP